MERRLPPFRMDPDLWARVNLRKDASKLAAYFVTTGLAAGVASYFVLRSPSYSLVLTVALIVLGPIGHALRSRSTIRRQKGLPWEEQRVVLTEVSYQTTYESGFNATVPWTKVRGFDSFPEGLLLRLEGKAYVFIPRIAVDPETEAFVKSRIKL